MLLPAYLSNTRWRLLTTVYSFNCWTSSRKAVNTNFCSLWFGQTWNRTHVYRFNGRHSIHLKTDQLKYLNVHYFIHSLISFLIYFLMFISYFFIYSLMTISYPFLNVDSVISKLFFRYTRCITPKLVTSLQSLFPRHEARKHRSFWRNIAVVVIHWQHCVWFNWPEIWTSNLPLQRRTRYRSSQWQVHLQMFIDYYIFPKVHSLTIP